MRPRRPHVICHMASSIDGRIVTKPWKLPSSFMAEYERTAATFRASAWMVGRVSMEPYAGKARVPTRVPSNRIPRTDFVGRRDARSYAIALDPSGKLTWTSNAIDEDHVIAVLTERVSDAYLAFLRARGVSYIFGGKASLKLKLVLEKLRRMFGIEKLLLEGGGKINGSFLEADLIDELSVLVTPIADGGIGSPSLFDSRWGQGPVRHLKLVSARKLAGDRLWLRYELKH